MSPRIKGLDARKEKRSNRSRNQVRAKERIRQERMATAGERAERELAEAEEWARRNPPPKLRPSAAVVTIRIPGLPTKTIRVRRYGGEIIACGKITTPKQLGRTLGTLIDQFL